VVGEVIGSEIKACCDYSNDPWQRAPMAGLVDDTRRKIKGCTSATRHGWRRGSWSDVGWMTPSESNGQVHYTSCAWLDGLTECRSLGGSD
jgi:hypothetical protein